MCGGLCLLSGGPVGIRKVGIVQVRRQACWDVQRGEQTQAFYRHSSHRVSLPHLPGETWNVVTAAVTGHGLFF